MGYNKMYASLLEDLLMNGEAETNKRTNVRVKRLQGKTLTIDIRQGIPMLWLRKTSMKIMAAELAWTLSGEQSTSWLTEHTSIWKKFEDTPGMINRPYGYMWREWFERDQVMASLTLAKVDPSSRQNLVLAWDPATDGLNNAAKKKNVPCPFAYQVLISKDKLTLIVSIRSSDVFLGLPYDIGMYSLLAHAYCKSLGVMPNKLVIQLGDYHLYENQFECAHGMIVRHGQYQRSFQEEHIPYCMIPLEMIQMDKDHFVKQQSAFTMKTLDYSPKVEVCI